MSSKIETLRAGLASRRILLSSQARGRAGRCKSRFCEKISQNKLVSIFEFYTSSLSVKFDFCRKEKPEIFKLLVNLDDEDDLDDVQFCEQTIRPITIDDTEACAADEDIKFEVEVKTLNEDCGGLCSPLLLAH